MVFSGFKYALLIPIVLISKLIFYVILKSFVFIREHSAEELYFIKYNLIGYAKIQKS